MRDRFRKGRAFPHCAAASRNGRSYSTQAANMTEDHKADIAVVGAGVFGAWTAYQLRRAGADVLLVDAYGPANSRASSGGESRILRFGYGPDAIYTRMAQRSLDSGNNFSIPFRGPQLFQSTGFCGWLASRSLLRSHTQNVPAK